ncbi:CubicO group peptidase (beta-lactamase class C family) [Rubricella aquisinus]|uniref:CubicO group peptidase (Beta-lactamase class C family) n=1 Tax=Rubricella aquisinus TaxID=2028108 RepID=A0A840WMY5_9RHOB|nr:serine hydrolase domain-containing protein [Rubricella aquisinus]MBB5515022.1 CubicO group peptidase (beta-lactamase class C family) [Rubricella aquisinus]
MSNPLPALSRNGTLMTPEGGPPGAWWSLTKPVLAVAMLKLAEQGRIDLDASYEAHPFTFLQLLANTSGVPNYTDLPAYRADVAAGVAPWTDADLLTETGLTPRFPPGTAWAYSNTGFMLIRQTIERIMDRRIDEAIASLLFAPMGIADTRIAHAPEDMAACAWAGDRAYHPGWVYHRMAVGPASDAVRFLDSVFQGGFLSAAGRARLTQRTELGPGPKGRPWRTAAYGLGLMAGEMQAGRAFGHSGVGPYSVSAAYHFPDRPDRPTACAFGPGADETEVEWQVVRAAYSPD